ncbi:hypothetical protein [Frateuria sp. Soil773]|nr:hypothetical protein [Frateuria sp. Soil773]
MVRLVLAGRGPAAGIVGGIAWYLWRNPSETSDTFTDVDPAGLGPTRST